jgi:hypothetical protein
VAVTVEVPLLHPAPRARDGNDDGCGFEDDECEQVCTDRRTRVGRQKERSIVDRGMKRITRLLAPTTVIVLVAGCSLGSSASSTRPPTTGGNVHQSSLTTPSGLIVRYPPQWSARLQRNVVYPGAGCVGHLVSGRWARVRVHQGSRLATGGRSHGHGDGHPTAERLHQHPGEPTASCAPRPRPAGFVRGPRERVQGCVHASEPRGHDLRRTGQPGQWSRPIPRRVPPQRDQSEIERGRCAECRVRDRRRGEPTRPTGSHDRPTLGRAWLSKHRRFEVD